MYFHVCPYCGANLDPGEHCDCADADEDACTGEHSSPLRGRLRALPVADAASKKEGQRSKFGSEPTAAGGGNREASEWPRSKKSRKSVSPMIFSGTATGGNVVRKCLHEIATGSASPRNDSYGGYAKEEAPADVGASTEAGVSME